MADLAASITTARNAGYSDADITAYLAKDPTLGPQVAQARKVGYADNEIVDHLATPKPKPSSFVDSVKGYASGLEKGIATAADAALAFTPLGAVSRVITGQNPFAPSMGGPAGDLIARHVNALAYTPQTAPGRMAKTVGEFTPVAIAPGSAPARVANVVVPALGSQIAGSIAHRAGASPEVEQAARFGGALMGGAGASARVGRPGSVSTPDDVVANVLAKRAGADPNAMQQQAQSMRGSGVEPTLLDVTGPKGQRLTRAVGVTNDAAGETLANNAQRVSATTKPAVMARTRALTGESRTADQLAADLKTGRDKEARTTYGKFYDNTFVEVPDAVKDMLADSSGRSIIARARQDAIENQDWGRQVELDKLLQTTTRDGQLPQISAGTLDRLQIAARERGAKFAAQGNNSRARGALQRRDQINELLDGIPELKPARAAYRAKSQAMDILETPGARKDPFSTDPTDYKAWVDSLPPEAQHANQVAIRQDILDTLGGQRAGTAGTIDELATSQYAKENLAHALGGQEASAYLSNLQGRLSQRANASFASPNGGSRTAVLENDAGKAAGRVVNAADTLLKGARGDVLGLAAKTAAWLKTRGLSDAESQALAEASTDPSRVQGVIAALNKRGGPKEAQAFLTFRGGLIGAARGTAQRTRPQPQ